MNNDQWSKCKVCGLDEKFVVNERRACKNKCMEKKKNMGPAVTGYWG